MNIDDFVDTILTGVVSPLLKLLIAVSFLIFVFGLLKALKNSDDPEVRQKSFYLSIYSIVGFAFLLGFNTIIKFLSI